MPAASESHCTAAMHGLLVLLRAPCWPAPMLLPLCTHRPCPSHLPPPPPRMLSGVDDITAVIIILLENNPKDKSWGAAQKLMNNVDKFMERLRGFKAVVDEGKVRGGSAACLSGGPQSSMPSCVVSAAQA